MMSLVAMLSFGVRFCRAEKSEQGGVGGFTCWVKKSMTVSGLGCRKYKWEPGGPFMYFLVRIKLCPFVGPPLPVFKAPFSAMTG